MTSHVPYAARMPEKINVLVLDDQRFDRHNLCRLCSGLTIKCEVSQADCLKTLVEQLDSTAFDLIFVDYNLPDGTGIEGLDMIRLSPRNANATSIMVTSYDAEEISFQAMAKGCADYITKDELSPSSFERAVTNALQKSVLSAQVQSQIYARAEVERVLNRFANQCVRDIKPMVSRMIRQLRTLRESPDDDLEKQHQHRADVETSCLHLWEFLEELGAHRADVMMKDMIGSLTPLPVASLANPDGPRHWQRKAKPVSSDAEKRPPSPFSRPTQ